MVPVMFNCEEKNFLGLCRALNDIANRARAKQIAPDELSGSTFTISNFGVFDVTIGTPIINQPNVGILGVGAVKKRPVVVENENGDSIAVQSMMNLSLAKDSSCFEPHWNCLLYTSPSPRDQRGSRMPSSA